MSAKLSFVHKNLSINIYRCPSLRCVSLTYLFFLFLTRDLVFNELMYLLVYNNYCSFFLNNVKMRK